MTPTAIRVKNIGKEYRLGQLMNTYRTLRESITERVRNNRQALKRRKIQFPIPFGRFAMLPLM